MLTTTTAQTIYSKLCQAPSAWFRSKEGKALTAKAIALVRQKCGDSEADTLADLLTLAEIVPLR